MNVKVYLEGIGCLNEYLNVKDFIWISDVDFSFTSEGGKKLTFHHLPVQVTEEKGESND